MSDSPSTTRHYAIDYARFVAIIGMVGVHVIAPVFESFRWSSVPQYLVWIVGNGNASTLFAILGGCSIVLASRRLLADHQPGRAVLRIIVRGLLIAVIGLLLGTLSPPMLVVLTPYGLAMCVVAAFILVPSWVVAALTAALVISGGWILTMLRMSMPDMSFANSPTLVELTDPAGLLTQVLVTGSYPLITWATYMLAGILIGRLVLAGKSRRFWFGVSLASAAVYAALWVYTVNQLLPLVGRETMGVLSLFGMGSPLPPEVATPFTVVAHTGSIGDMLGTGSFSVMMIALLMGIVRNTRQPLLLRPIRAAGAAPLTIYCTHVVLAAAFMKGVELGWPVPDFGPPAWFAHVGLILLIGTVLAILDRRGPLETFVGWIAKTVVPARRAPEQTTVASSDDVGAGVPHLDDGSLARTGSDSSDQVGKHANVDTVSDRVES